MQVGLFNSFLKKEGVSIKIEGLGSYQHLEGIFMDVRALWYKMHVKERVGVKERIFILPLVMQVSESLHELGLLKFGLFPLRSRAQRRSNPS